MKRIFVIFFCLLISCFFVGCAGIRGGIGIPPIVDGEQGIVPPSDNDTLPPDEPNEGPQDPTPNPNPPSDPNPEPSPNPEPNPEPEPPTPPAVIPDMLVVSSTDGLSVRSGRGTAYSKIGSMNKNDMAGYIDLVSGWYKIPYKNGVGYISSAYCTTMNFNKASAAVEQVIAEGKKLLGLPYVYGAQRYHWGNGVKNALFDGQSYDCSSLTQYIFKIGANVNLATTSREQSLQGTLISKSNLSRGDLMYFTNDSRENNTGLERIGHVALFLGDNTILHTASDYAVIESISAKRWSYFINARRCV